MSHLSNILSFHNVIDKYKYAEKNTTKKEDKNGYINYHFSDGGQYGICWEGEMIKNEVREWDAK